MATEPAKTPGSRGAAAFVRGATIRTVAQAMWRAGAFVVGLVLVRTMSADHAGKYFFVISLGAFLGLVFDAGLFQAISREAPRADAREQGSGDALFVTALRSMTILAGVVIVAATAVLILSRNDRIDLVAVAGVFGVALALQTLSATFLRVRGRPAVAELYQAWIPLSFLIVVGVLAVMDRIDAGNVIGLRLAIEVVAVAFLVATARSMVVSRRARVRVGTIMSSALPLWMTGLAWMGLEQADVVLLGFMRSDAAVGVYAPTLRLVALAALPFGILFPYVMLASARLTAAGKRDEVRRLYEVGGKIALVAGAPVMAAMFMAPGSILELVLDIDAASAHGAARILVVGFFVHAALGMNSGVVEAVVGLKALAVRSVVVLVVVLVADAVLVSTLGITGAALGTAIGYAAVVAANAALLWRDFDLKPLPSGMLVTLSALAFSTLVATATGLPQRNLWMLAMCVAVVTAVTLWSAWSTTHPDDRSLIEGALARKPPNEAAIGLEAPP